MQGTHRYSIPTASRILIKIWINIFCLFNLIFHHWNNKYLNNLAMMISFCKCNQAEKTTKTKKNIFSPWHWWYRKQGQSFQLKISIFRNILASTCIIIESCFLKQDIFPTLNSVLIMASICVTGNTNFLWKSIYKFYCNLNMFFHSLNHPSIQKPFGTG